MLFRSRLLFWLAVDGVVAAAAEAINFLGHWFGGSSMVYFSRSGCVWSVGSGCAAVTVAAVVIVDLSLSACASDDGATSAASASATVVGVASVVVGSVFVSVSATATTSAAAAAVDDGAPESCSEAAEVSETLPLVVLGPRTRMVGHSKTFLNLSASCKLAAIESGYNAG